MRAKSLSFHAILLSAALGCVCAPRLTLAAMLECGLDQLCSQSLVIARGKVTGLESFWNAEKTAIFTDVTIELRQTYKGAPPSVFTIRQMGGEIANPDGTGMGLAVSHAPRFEKNDEVLLFLQSSPLSAWYRATAGAQGKYRIQTDARTGAAYVRNPPVDLLDSRTGKARRVRPAQWPLEEFERGIRRTVEKQAAAANSAPQDSLAKNASAKNTGSKNASAPSENSPAAERNSLP